VGGSAGSDESGGDASPTGDPPKGAAPSAPAAPTPPPEKPSNWQEMDTLTHGRDLGGESRDE
jgi:hypothetical protein